MKRVFSNNLLKKGISDSKYYLIANIGNKALAFLVIPILAKSIGVKEFAIYDLFLVIGNFLNILIVLGIDSGIVILLAESKSDEKRLSFLFIISLIISIFLIAIISLGIKFIFFYRQELFLLNGYIWTLLLLYTLFRVINYHTFNFLRWRQKAKEASFITLFSYIAGMLIGLIFLYFNKTVISYLEGLVLGMLIGAILALYIARDYIFNFKVIDNAKELITELFKLSLPFVPNYLGKSLMQMADRVVILMLFGQYELGIYAVITKLAMIPQVIIGTIASGFLPVMYSNYSTQKGQALIRNFFHSYLALIPIFFIIASLIDTKIVEMFSDSNYANFSYLFPIALISILFVQSSQTNGFGYTIKRKTHYIMYITFFTVVINYILSLIFGYFIGLEGIILGTLIAGILKTYLYTLYSEKLYSFNYNIKFIIIISLVSLIFSLLNIVDII